MAAIYKCVGCGRRYGGRRDACPACGAAVQEEKPAQKETPVKKKGGCFLFCIPVTLFLITGVLMLLL